jgi:hypothetical protein
MQVKSIPYDHKSHIRKHFFLIMIVPLLLGLFITLTNFVRAEWTQEDPLLNISPTKQGWKQIQVNKHPPKIQRFDKKS